MIWIAIIICEEITVDDFERITDEHPYRFKEDFAEQKGLMELMEINFDIIKDKQFGKEFIQIETIPENLIYQGKIYLIVYQYHHVYVDWIHFDVLYIIKLLHD